jgi:threonyl-tRNA synthetase
LRHSTAHLLAAAVLDLFPGTKLGIGPALLDDPRYGFFYDVIAPQPLTEADLPVIEKRMKQIASKNLGYRREEISKEEALRVFGEREEPLKCELIDEKAGEKVSVYYIDGSPFIDFCLGPHVPNTNKLRAFKLLSLAGAYWKGDASQPQMQRIYGTAFFTQEELDAWLKQREEAEKRDHRRLGRELDLFSIQEDYGQGLVFWHPKGGAIRKEMEDYLRQQLLLRGYGLVFTPHIAKRELWFTSGHEINYVDSMFSPMEFEEQEFRIKPMNCPFHIGIYKSAQHSYRDLPLRYAELGTCYRAELSGALHGLIRVRGFTQDDAHIFCTPETVRGEIVSCLDFALSVYEAFGFNDFKVELSVRGDDHTGFFGEDQDWETAESALVDALNTRGLAYERIEGEAAFYGPKIDIRVKDAIGRAWQLTTVQFDFNLPQRFQLEYIGEDNKPHQPIMIHRALFGSMERFFGVLIEHYAGAFPMWLAPVQIAVLPITDRVNEYAEEVARELRVAGFRVEANLRSEKIGAKIRDAQLQKVPFMLVLGDREMEQKTVAVRERARGDIGVMSIAEFKEMAQRLVATRALVNN